MYSSGFLFQSSLFCIRETASAPYCQKGSLTDWPEEELNRIRVVLQKVTGLRVNNPEDAEDLVQETLLTMALRCPDVTIEKGLLIWGIGILRNKVGNYYRKNRTCGPAGNFPGHEIGCVRFESPEASLHYAELCSLVDAVLRDLSLTERRPIELLLAGMPTSEIVAHLHPERYQNVVNRLHRGRKKIALQLAKLGYGEGRPRYRRLAGRRKGRMKRAAATRAT